MEASDLGRDLPELTAQDVADIIGLSYHAVLRAAHAGEVSFYKIRGRIRFSRSDVLVWIDGCRVDTDDTPRRRPRLVPPAHTGPAEVGSLESLRALERKYLGDA